MFSSVFTVSSNRTSFAHYRIARSGPLERSRAACCETIILKAKTTCMHETAECPAGASTHEVVSGGGYFVDFVATRNASISIPQVWTIHSPLHRPLKVTRDALRFHPRRLGLPQRASVFSSRHSLLTSSGYQYPYCTCTSSTYHPENLRPSLYSVGERRLSLSPGHVDQGWEGSSWAPVSPDN